jgi:xanthine dehydrogenase accessory factor
MGGNFVEINNQALAGNIYTRIPDLLNDKSPFLLATVTGTHGSAPQVPGSVAIIGETGLITGTVGGGSVEIALLKLASDALYRQTSAWHHFNLGHDLSSEEGSICGGGMRILVDCQPYKHLQVFQQLATDTKRRVPGVIATHARSDQDGKFRIDRTWITPDNLDSLPAPFHPETGDLALAMLKRAIRGECLEISFPEESPAGGFLLLELILPQPRLLIAGAGHVGKALSHLGRLLDYEVIVWDDRPEYAHPGNLPDASEIWSGSPDEAFGTLIADNDTSMVIVTRGHRTDAEVLKKLILSNAGYIGMIGSRKKILIMREQFLAEGWATPEQWDRIHAPIGLEIGSKTVNEIALSIAAQLVQVRNSKKHHHG